METVRYLRDHGNDVESLWVKGEFHITARAHQEFPRLFQLKYARGPFHHLYAQECRSLILELPEDPSASAVVVAWGFKKFFNLGAPLAPTVPGDQPVTVYEKIDGSIMMLYFYEESWHVSSSSVPDASGPIYGRNGAETVLPEDVATFADLFWHAWNELSYGAFPEDRGLCYIFELCSRSNVILVQYEEDFRLVLLGARDMSTLRELRPEPIAARNGWACIQPIPALKTLNDAVAASKALDPLKCEGFVAVIGETPTGFIRVKIKCPQYVMLHHLCTATFDVEDKKNSYRFLSIILKGETDEFVAYFPRLEKPYHAVKSRYKIMCLCLQAHRDACTVAGEEGPVVNMRDFVLACVPLFRQGKKYSGVFGFLGKSTLSVEDAFSRWTVKKLGKVVNAFRYVEE